LRAQPLAEPERSQFAHGIQLQVNAVAERREPRRGVIDAARDPDLVQAQRT
jgi:hypothetical protein